MLDAAGPSDEMDTLSGYPRRESFIKRHRNILIGIVVVLILIAVVVTIVVTRGVEEDERLYSRIQIDNLMGHLSNLQDIATENNGNRAANTSGYAQSVQYVINQLKSKAGNIIDPNSIQIQDFTYPILVQQTNATFSQIHPVNVTYTYNTDFAFFGSQGGDFDISGNVSVVSNLGCDISDYEGTTPDTIFIISRGNCTFNAKLVLAQQKQALAAVIYNNVAGLYSANSVVLLPTIITTYTLGVSLVSQAASGLTLNIGTNTNIQNLWTSNVIADTKQGDGDKVIVVGSHLDSVPAGPGINDNGSGSSLNLELAIQFASSRLMYDQIKNKIRFIWFGAEELGLLGSYYYVNNLNNSDLEAFKKIQVNLNFDMLGSPNFIRGVYNGSNDNTTKGSRVVESLFNSYFSGQKLPTTPTAFDPAIARSDYGPFLALGIPAGGLATGAEGIKTMDERVTYGGFAGAQYDPCYHKACDTVDNINKEVYVQMGQAAAYVLQELAKSEDLVQTLNP